uniref:Uncharacterized protein n=1 Tax=Sphaerodactylus townsendi TaxID=933632 RepID=A0ACB8ES61_9SAUR
MSTREPPTVASEAWSCGAVLGTVKAWSHEGAGRRAFFPQLQRSRRGPSDGCLPEPRRHVAGAYLARMALWVPLLALLCLSWAAEGAGCGECQPERCPSVRCAAPELTARDECGCCERCLSVEGERCGGARGARCGPGLVCVSQRAAAEEGGGGEEEEEEEGTGRCVCEEDGAVCGSDGRSYSSVCALHLHNWRALHGARERVRKAHDGECKLAKK